MHHQQLLVILPNQGDFQVSDEYLFELAHHMLGAKKPSGMRVGLNIGREMLVGSRGMNLLNRFNNQEVLTKDPEERAWLLASAKPIVVELLRKVYTNDVSKLIPEISVIQPSDKSLDQYRCIDGHFATNVVYARHPVDPNFFIRVANFHSYLLQEKRAEFFRLAASLGAKAINQSDVNKSSSQGVAQAGFEEPTKSVNLKATSSFSHQQGSRFDLTASFEEATAEPKMPENMKWLNQEPLWRAMVEARLNNWVDRFTLSFTYSQDFNINAELVGMISEVGFSAGGNFSKINVIDQEYTVDFFPRSAYK